MLLRHGQSEWNLQDRFTGWTDVGLTAQGQQEAVKAGELLQRWGFTIDLAFTSVLSRAVHTSVLALREMGQMHTPTRQDWRLNERHYGALQGENKSSMASKASPEQVKAWRSSYDVRPPLLDRDDPRHPANDDRYRDVPSELLPAGESLKDTLERVVPYYRAEVEPAIRAGEEVMIVAHGNSLRALVKHLDGIPDDQVDKLYIPNGLPLVYELDADLKPVRKYYLQDA